MNQTTQIKLTSVTQVVDQFKLKDINLELKKGRVYGLVGENGCGKTLLVKLMCGINEPDQGTIVNDGVVVYIPDEFPFSSKISIRSFEKVMKAANPSFSPPLFSRIVRSFGVDYLEKISSCSGGELKCIMFCAGIASGGDLLILDEISNGMDAVAKDKFIETILEFVSDESKTVIMAGHHVDEIEQIADTIIIMSQGAIAHVADTIDFINRYQFWTGDHSQLDIEGVIFAEQRRFATTALVDTQVFKKECEKGTLQKILVYMKRGGLL